MATSRSPPPRAGRSSCNRRARLRWIDSPNSDAGARRGFCGECGSSLFWDPPARDTISIAAGTLDGPTGLSTAAHWYVHRLATTTSAR